MDQYILTAENIQKTYNGNKILHDLSIYIRKGEIYGLIGKNGSGKTTLFRILTGLTQRYKGRILINGCDNGKVKISAVINSPSLFFNLDAFENLKIQGILLGIKSNYEILQILKTVELEGCGNKLVGKFSQGMIQRLKIGMALLGDPDILVLDEPANGLDPDGIVKLRRILLRLNQTEGTTILISSHILRELERVVTRFGILHDGRIVKEVSTQKILKDRINLEELYIQLTKGGRDNDEYMEK